MARRATPVTKGRTSPKQSPAATQPARSAKSKLHDESPTTMPEDSPKEMASDVQEAQPAPAAKARRGRKPKSEALIAAPESTEAAAAAEPELALPEPEAEAPPQPPSPRKTRRNREPEASAPPPLETADEASVERQVAAAAEWHPESGTVTFDWPAIEEVAATDGPNQPMAKLLLAARAEGASSRWPF